MLRVKHSNFRKKDQWIVYDTRNFKYHTHCYSKEIALKLKYFVEHHIMPRSENDRFIDSLIRLARDNAYRRKLEQYKADLKKGE